MLWLAHTLTSKIENGFILSSELSIESKFDSTKFVELESGSSQPNESESVDFDSANLDISVLSRSSLSFSFEYVVKSLLPLLSHSLFLINKKKKTKNAIESAYFSVP